MRRRRGAKQARDGLSQRLEQIEAAVGEHPVGVGAPRPVAVFVLRRAGPHAPSRVRASAPV